MKYSKKGKNIIDIHGNVITLDSVCDLLSTKDKEIDELKDTLIELDFENAMQVLFSIHHLETNSNAVLMKGIRNLLWLLLRADIIHIENDKFYTHDGEIAI